MKVRELIKMLETMPQNKDVVVYKPGDDYATHIVGITENNSSNSVDIIMAVDEDEYDDDDDDNYLSDED